MRLEQAYVLLACLAPSASTQQILSSSGFTNCLPGASITVNDANVQFDKALGTVTFEVSGTSTKVQKVKAALVVTAYGTQVFEKDFDPCDAATKVDQLCPVPSGAFAANGTQAIPSNFLSQIPSIAFSVPDLDGMATIKLKAVDGGQDVACVQSGVTNGKTMEIPAVSYVAAGIAGASLLLTGFSAMGGAGSVGGHPPSPSFGSVLGWFQSITMNGMLSISYPLIYRSFAKNFAFSSGLISWNSMQSHIDSFRSRTGGNLTANNVQFLQNASLAYTDRSSNTTAFRKRSDNFLAKVRFARQITTNANGSDSSNSSTAQVTHVVSGIQGYVEQLTIPQANMFMTVLEVFAVIVTAIVASILLLKVILEIWALFASFPKKLTDFRKRYWRLAANTITNLILLLYGIWTIYCIYQFTNGDSWAAKLLAGITLGFFTAVLIFFSVRIWIMAHKYRKAEGDVSGLYENKDTWFKYSLFYDSYKQRCWWLFIPVIVYMFAKGCVIAVGDGHGLTQTASQLVVESLMLVLLLLYRPFATLGGNLINIGIQVVRVLSVVCILVFVETLGIAQTTKTITGLVLIVLQAVLTGLLAILIAVNAIIVSCKENPHQKRRKEAEKLNRNTDNLTPLDTHNSLLLAPEKTDGPTCHAMGPYHSRRKYEPIPSTSSSLNRDDSAVPLVRGAVPMSSVDPQSRMRSRADSDAMPLIGRQPTIPNLGYQGYGQRAL